MTNHIGPGPRDLQAKTGPAGDIFPRTTASPQDRPPTPPPEAIPGAPAARSPGSPGNKTADTPHTDLAAERHHDRTNGTRHGNRRHSPQPRIGCREPSASPRRTRVASRRKSRRQHRRRGLEDPVETSVISQIADRNLRARIADRQLPTAHVARENDRDSIVVDLPERDFNSHHKSRVGRSRKDRRRRSATGATRSAVTGIDAARRANVHARRTTRETPETETSSTARDAGSRTTRTR